MKQYILKECPANCRVCDETGCIECIDNLLNPSNCSTCKEKYFKPSGGSDCESISI